MSDTSRRPNGAEEGAAAPAGAPMKTTEAKAPTTTYATPPTTEAKPGPVPGVDVPDAKGRQPFELWAAAKKTPDGELRTAKVLKRWPAGRILTESEFDAAIVAGRNLVFR